MKRATLFALVLLLTFIPVLCLSCSSDDSDEITSETSPAPVVTQSPTPAPTEIEEEGFYRNTIYGFSISYPPEWTAQKGGPNEPLLVITAPDQTGVVQIVMQPLFELATAEEYASTVLEEFGQVLDEIEMISASAVDLGGESGYDQVFTGTQAGASLTYQMISVVRGSQAFIVMAASPSVFFSSLADTFDQIIYSFRLEEPRIADVPRKGSLALYDTGPLTLDPATVQESISASYVMEIFSGLVSLSTDLEVIGDIAWRWDISDDGLTYTFHLREDVQFHDGEKVTASDVKYSLERACAPATGSKTAANFLGDIVGVKDKLAGNAAEISGVKVIDDYTLSLTIDAPKAYFLTKLVHPVSFVVDWRNVSDGDEWWREPNSTGPFKLKEWSEDELLILKRNDNYYGELPKIENVIFRLWAGIPIVMYETSEIDIASVTVTDIERVLDPQSSLHNELVTVDEFSVWYIGFNTTKAPFDDPKVRQAFSYAADKDKLSRLVLKNMVSPAEGILPPGMPGFNEQLRGLEFDPEQAKQLLRESNYPDLTTVTFTTAGRGDISPINEALVDMWRQNLGVEVEIRQIEPEIYTEVLGEEKNELFDLGWIADYPDPQNFLDVLFHSESHDNYGEYSNHEIDGLLETAREELDTDKRLAMYQEIEQMLVDDAACLPLFFSTSYYLVKPYVRGFVAAPLPIPWLKYVYIEETD